MLEIYPGKTCWRWRLVPLIACLVWVHVRKLWTYFKLFCHRSPICTFGITENSVSVKDHSWKLETIFTECFHTIVNGIHIFCGIHNFFDFFTGESQVVLLHPLWFTSRWFIHKDRTGGMFYVNHVLVNRKYLHVDVYMLRPIAICLGRLIHANNKACCRQICYSFHFFRRFSLIFVIFRVLLSFLGRRVVQNKFFRGHMKKLAQNCPLYVMLLYMSNDL